MMTYVFALTWGLLAKSAIATAAAAETQRRYQNPSCCRFSKVFHDADWQDEVTRRLFKQRAIKAERRFFAEPGVAYDQETGMTFDGISLDPATGELNRGPPPAGPFGFSAASKEALHLSLLALALNPSFVGKDLAPLVYGEDEAMEILEKKVKTMEDFDKAEPGYGGFLPWFCSRGAIERGRVRQCRSLQDEASTLAPTNDFFNKVPGLDNGQLAWGTYAVARTLRRRAVEDPKFNALAKRWEARLERMRTTAVPLFYAGRGTGAVRAVSKIVNTSRDAFNASDNAETMMVYPAFLDDAYEGELMVLFMDLLADWSAYPNSGLEERNKMWERKQIKLVARNYTTANGSDITVQEGFWFSSHEQWKLMVLPYLEIPLVNQVFTNSEYVRVLDAINRGIPGLFASSHAPPNVRCGRLGGYCNAVGVQEVASQVVYWDQSVTPYGAYPVMLVDQAAGLAWYNIMLSLPKMQTETGSVEASDVHGTAVAAVLTWDTKVTSVLAMLGGTGPLISSFLAADGHREQFQERVGKMYSEVFSGRLSSPQNIRAGNGAALPWPPGNLLPGHWESVDSAFPTCLCNTSTAASTPRLRGNI